MSERNTRERPGSPRADIAVARRTAARDEGMERLRKLTRVSVLGATGLVGLFAFVAARAVPGHRLHTSTPAGGASRAATSASSGARSQSPSSAAPSLAPPSSPPAPSMQAPTVVSGGS
jgi:cytoskeletal protein RodZ